MTRWVFALGTRRKTDYLEAFRAVMLGRLVRFALIVILGLLIVQTAFFGLRDRDFRGVAGDAFFDVVCALAVVAVGYWLTISSAARRMHARHERITGARYVLDADGIHYESSASQAFTPWSAFRAFRETRNLLLFFQPRLRFQFLPKASLVEGDLAALRAFLASRPAEGSASRASR